jgi:hypothetical protein
MSDITDRGQAVSRGEKRAAEERYKPGLFAPSWDSQSNKVVPSMNRLESNFPRKIKVDGLMITPDGVVKGKQSRQRTRVRTVDGAK